MAISQTTLPRVFSCQEASSKGYDPCGWDQSAESDKTVSISQYLYRSEPICVLGDASPAGRDTIRSARLTPQRCAPQTNRHRRSCRLKELPKRVGSASRGDGQR
jgi:hypothetical protein